MAPTVRLQTIAQARTGMAALHAYAAVTPVRTMHRRDTAARPCDGRRPSRRQELEMDMEAAAREEQEAQTNRSPRGAEHSIA